MAIDMTTVKQIMHNNKEVAKIEDSLGNILWQKAPSVQWHTVYEDDTGTGYRITTNSDEYYTKYGYNTAGIDLSSYDWTKITKMRLTVYYYFGNDTRGSRQLYKNDVGTSTSTQTATEEWTFTEWGDGSEYYYLAGTRYNNSNYSSSNYVYLSSEKKLIPRTSYRGSQKIGIAPDYDNEFIVKKVELYY